MTDDEEKALAVLLAEGRLPFDCGRCFHLSRAEILALVRGLVAARPALKGKQPADEGEHGDH